MEPIGAHLTLMSVQITASVSASANNSVSASANNDDAQISNCANTICSHYKPPEGVMLWVHCSCDSSLKSIGTHLTVETLLHHVFIVHVIPHVSIGAHLTVHMSTVFHM